MLLGGALGLLGSALDILIWSSMERPEVLVRLGCERIHIGVTVSGGLVAGLVYGAILSGMVDPRGLRKNVAFVLPATLLVATASYAAGDLLSIRIMNIYPWLGAHLVAFLAALAIARFGAGPPRRTTLSGSATNTTVI